MLSVATRLLALNLGALLSGACSSPPQTPGQAPAGSDRPGSHGATSRGATPGSVGGANPAAQACRPPDRAMLTRMVKAVDWNRVDADPEAECAQRGHRWMTFGTTSAHHCDLLCTDGGDALTDSCLCPKAHCWLRTEGKATCVKLPPPAHGREFPYAAQ